MDTTYTMEKLGADEGKQQRILAFMLTTIHRMRIASSLPLMLQRQDFCAPNGTLMTHYVLIKQHGGPKFGYPTRMLGWCGHMHLCCSYWATDSIFMCIYPNVHAVSIAHSSVIPVCHRLSEHTKTTSPYSHCVARRLCHGTAAGHTFTGNSALEHEFWLSKESANIDRSSCARAKLLSQKIASIVENVPTSVHCVGSTTRYVHSRLQTSVPTSYGPMGGRALVKGRNYFRICLLLCDVYMSVYGIHCQFDSGVIKSKSGTSRHTEEFQYPTL